MTNGNAPVLIAGAGIGGLTVALALARRDIPSIVLERAVKPEPVGAGIQLSPNAGRVLDQLGLGIDLERVSGRPQALELASGATGRRGGDIPLGPVSETRYGAPYRVLHRADLHDVLMQAAEKSSRITLRFGTTVTEAQPADASLSAMTSGGAAESFTGRLLVGADGVRSVVAARLGLPPATYSGLTAWRAMLPQSHAESSVIRLWLHEHSHLVAYPVAGGRALNLVLVLEQKDSAPEGSIPPMEKAAWAEEPRKLIEAVASWSAWPLFVRRAETGWRGPVTLLGDAAHPMLPFLAQGAAMAIEDAAVLASALRRYPPEQAARKYELDRLARWQRIQSAASRTGRIYHLGGAAALARDTAMQLMPANLRLAPQDWLFGWRPPA